MLLPALQICNCSMPSKVLAYCWAVHPNYSTLLARHPPLLSCSYVIDTTSISLIFMNQCQCSLNTCTIHANNIYGGSCKGWLINSWFKVVRFNPMENWSVFHSEGNKLFEGFKSGKQGACSSSSPNLHSWMGAIILRPRGLESCHGGRVLISSLHRIFVSPRAAMISAY